MNQLRAQKTYHLTRHKKHGQKGKSTLENNIPQPESNRLDNQ